MICDCLHSKSAGADVFVATADQVVHLQYTYSASEATSILVSTAWPLRVSLYAFCLVAILSFGALFAAGYRIFVRFYGCNHTRAVGCAFTQSGKDYTELQCK